MVLGSGFRRLVLLFFWGGFLSEVLRHSRRFIVNCVYLPESLLFFLGG